MSPPPPLPVTEDTPPDMLAGSMDLRAVLPGGRTVKVSVERSTPMMDLLVQVTTANKMSTGGYVIQALGERGVLPYKPSTPIGALDTWTIHIVPKSQLGLSGRKAPSRSASQPFETTFRLQVHLPRNQLYVTRVSPKTRLADILVQVCNEKNLDPTRYSLRHPDNLDHVLSLSCCLADYSLQQVALVSNRVCPLSVSSADIMALQQRDSEPFAFSHNRNKRSCDGSVSSGSLGGRSLSPACSDESSASPPPPPPPPPARPTRKRRPAPKPPIINQIVQHQDEGGTGSATVICHSRNSSDSSGYHEASVLSESPETGNSLPDSLPRRSKLPSASPPGETKGNNLSRSLSNLAPLSNNGNMMRHCSHSQSASSLASIPGRKKKAAPPPPVVEKMSSLSEEQFAPSIALNGGSRKAATLPPSNRVPFPPSHSPDTVVDIEQPGSASLAPDSHTRDLQDTGPKSDAQLQLADDEIDRIFDNATRDHVDLEPPLSLLSLPSPPGSISKSATRQPDPLDWEYRLPAPPTAFRDSSSPTVTEFDTMTIGNLTEVFTKVDPEPLKESANSKSVVRLNRDETIVGKGKHVHSMRRETYNSHVQPSCHLSASGLHDNGFNRIQRKEGYGRPSSGKNAGTEVVVAAIIENDYKKHCSGVPTVDKSEIEEKDHLTSTDSVKQVEDEKTAVINELALVINERRDKTDNVIKERVKSGTELASSSTLENFKITTYLDKKPVGVFEDDSIKSSASMKSHEFKVPKTLERRNSFNSDEKPASRFVKRSKSHISLVNGARHPSGYPRPYRSQSLAWSNDNLMEDLDSDQKTDLARLKFETLLETPRLWKTTSELNINGAGNSAEESQLWHQQSISPSVTDLQSLQVLRSILPQLSQPKKAASLFTTDDTKPNRTVQDTVDHSLPKASERPQKETVKVPSAQQRHSYSGGPVTIDLTTWSERPKRQVSIKMDRDYVIGGNVKKEDTKPLEKPTSDEGKNNNFENGRPKLPEPNLTMRIISVSSSRTEKPIETKCSDLSRKPIVRAVELKKPYASIDYCQTNGFLQNGRSYEHLNHMIDDYGKFDYRILETPNEIEEFVGVHSLTKRFSVGVPKPAPVSSYLFGTFDSELVNNSEPDSSIKKLDCQGNSFRKYKSVVGINGCEESKVIECAVNKSENTAHGNSVNEKSVNECGSVTTKAQKKAVEINENLNSLKVSKQKKQLIPVVEALHAESRPGTIPAPPLQPVLKPVGKHRGRMLPPPQLDPRDTLLQSIRSFGGKQNLRKADCSK